MSLLEIKGVSKHFGGLAAVSDLTFNIDQGEILGLIGPNGAGKTTVFNLITGFLPPSGGRILFKGRDITGSKPYIIARNGIVRTFQLTTLFESKTVIENMVMAFNLEARSGFWAAMFNTHKTRKREKEILEKSLNILEFMQLLPFKEQAAGSLPHGRQRLLGISLAMAASPQLLLLDEPVTGMNPEETISAMELIKEIHKKGVTILLVEHDMRAVMGLCSRITVLNFGQKIAEGSPDEIRGNKDVIGAYLGTKSHVAQY